jgi:hypothetical protein
MTPGAVRIGVRYGVRIEVRTGVRRGVRIAIFPTGRRGACLLASGGPRFADFYSPAGDERE